MASSATASTATDPKDSRWFLTHEQILNSPSRKDGVPSDQELNLRQKAAYLIQDMGQKLRVSQLCINTAIVYMHRFYMFHSFQIFHRNGIAAAALFLAAKVEEQPRKLETVIQVLHASLNLKIPEPQTVAYQEQAQDLVFNENVLLQTLGFDVAVDHPHTHVVKTCHLVKACKDLAQTSYFLASNSLHLTTMCLQYRPTVVACFCIYLACKWSRWEIPQSTEGKYWFHYVDRTVTMEILEQLTNEFLIIYDNSPSRLKKQLSSCKGLGLNSKSPGQQPGQQQSGSSNSASRSQHTSSAEHRSSSSSSHHRPSLHHHAKQPPSSHTAGSGDYSKQQQMSSIKSAHNMPASSAVATSSSSNSSRQRPDRSINIPPEPHFSAPHRTAGTTKGSALLPLTRGNISDSNSLSSSQPPPQSSTSSTLASATSASSSSSSLQQHLHPRPNNHATHEQIYQPGASSSSSSSSSKNRGLLHTPTLPGSSTSASISQSAMVMNSQQTQQDSSQRHSVNKSDIHNKHRHGTKEHLQQQQQQPPPQQSKSIDMSKTKNMYQMNEQQKVQHQNSSAQRSTYPTQQPPPNYNQAMTNRTMQQDQSSSVLMQQQQHKSINNIGGTGANINSTVTTTPIESSFRLTDDIGRNNDLMDIDSPSTKQQTIKAPSMFSPEWNEKPNSALANMNKLNINNTIAANTTGSIVKSLNSDSPSRKSNNNNMTTNNISDRQQQQQQQRQQRPNKIYPDTVANIQLSQLPPSNDRNNLQTKRSHPEDLIQQEDGIDFRDAKYRKVDILPPPAHQQSAIPLAPSYTTMRQPSIDSIKSTSSFNGIETDPALVSSLLKESLCTDIKYSSSLSATSSTSSASNQLSNIPPQQLLQQSSDAIKTESITSQHQQNKQLPMYNLQAGQTIPQQHSSSHHHNHQVPPPTLPQQQQQQQIIPPTPIANVPITLIKQEIDTNSSQIVLNNLSSSSTSAPTASVMPVSSLVAPIKAEIHNEHEIKIKSEKKKKKEKHKHKEKDKDKSKDREERKKHKKDKDRQKDRERHDDGISSGGGGSGGGGGGVSSGNNNGGISGSGNGHNPIKITIPKDKLNLSSSSGNSSTGTHSYEQTQSTMQQQSTSGFKITIPKERIKSEVPPPPPSSSSSSTTQQQPTSLKIKISKDMIESYNNYGSSGNGGSNYEQSAYTTGSGGHHHNNGSGGSTILNSNNAIGGISSNTIGNSSNSSSSSKKKDKDRDKERGEKSKSSKNLDYIKQNGNNGSSGNGNIGGGNNASSQLQSSGGGGGGGGGHISNNTGRSGGGNGNSSSSSKVR